MTWVVVVRTIAVSVFALVVLVFGTGEWFGWWDEAGAQEETTTTEPPPSTTTAPVTTTTVPVTTTTAAPVEDVQEVAQEAREGGFSDALEDVVPWVVVALLLSIVVALAFVR